MKPWIWIVAGIALTALELIIPSFTIIWFGLAAIVVGLLSFIPGLDALAMQLGLWAVLSTVFTYCWFKYFRQQTRTMSGQSKEAIVGKAGIVVKVSDSTFPGGVIRFPIAVLGSDEWSFRSDEPLNVGDRGVIVDIAGDKLVIKKG